MEKNLASSARDVRDEGLVPGSGRSSGGGRGNPFQYSCLEKPMDGEAHGQRSLPAIAHGVTKCLT